MSTIDTDEGGLFFVDGPGSTGKTFLYRALLARVCSENKLAVATPTSGVAASIILDGRTHASKYHLLLRMVDVVASRNKVVLPRCYGEHLL